MNKVQNLIHRKETFMEVKKINLNYDKFTEKYPFDENPYIRAIIKHLLENLSAEVAKQKEEKGLRNKDLIAEPDLTPSIEDEHIEDEHAVSYLLNCKVVKARNPWLISDTNLQIISKNLNSTPYQLLWRNTFTNMNLSHANFENPHYIKSGHHISSVSLIDLFKTGINFLLQTEHKKIVEQALELYGPYTFAKYFDPDKLKEAKSLAIEFIFEDVKNDFLDEQEEFFKEGSTFKLNKQLREFYEGNLINLLRLYVESAPDFASKLVEVMKGANELAESVRRGKEETKEANLPVNEFDEAYSIIEKFAKSSESLLKLLVGGQQESMIDPNNQIKNSAKHFKGK